MSSINGKLGIRPAGKRAMMKLPEDRAIRNAVTSARCPKCQQFGARLGKVFDDTLGLWCSWCAWHWDVPRPKTADPLPSETKP